MDFYSPGCMLLKPEFRVENVRSTVRSCVIEFGAGVENEIRMSFDSRAGLDVLMNKGRSIPSRLLLGRTQARKLRFATQTPDLCVSILEVHIDCVNCEVEIDSHFGIWDWYSVGLDGVHDLSGYGHTNSISIAQCRTVLRNEFRTGT